jgi:hypothetical protein
MSSSTSRAKSSRNTKTRGRVGSVDSSGRGTARSSLTASAGGPEWMTERWELQVEAEARKRLKRSIRNIGAER